MPGSARHTGPATVIVRRRVTPGQAEAFERWQQGVIAEASRFEGHLGARVHRPANPATDDYELVFSFDTEAHLQQWEASPERADWLARAEALSAGAPRVQRVTGMEYWFSLPRHAAVRPPSRYKMAAVTVLAIFPLVLFLVPLLARLFSGLPRVLATLLTACAMVALMTWAVMPLLTRLFSFWLFPRSKG